MTGEQQFDDEYPMHARLRALGGADEHVGDFLRWLSARQWVVCSFDGVGTCYEPVKLTIPAMLGEYFSLDMAALEAEKAAILDSLRSAQPEPSA